MSGADLAYAALFFWWRVRLFALMTWYGYTPDWRWDFRQTWDWTTGEPWAATYFPRERGLRATPMEALREDWSYA